MTSLTVLALASTMMTSHAQTIEPRLLRQPDIHGNTVVFVYAGDLWASTTESGSVARRIATNVGARTGAANSPTTRPHISPDGKWVAALDLGSPPQIQLLPTGAGQARRLTKITLVLSWEYLSNIL